jgi:pimeloyl-ACP methyl ester carboxylesterase
MSQTPPAPVTPDALRTLGVPVSIAWGERSGPAYAQTSATAATLIPGCGWAEIPGAGHLWPEEDPKGFAGMVTAHLARLGVGA